MVSTRGTMKAVARTVKKRAASKQRKTKVQWPVEAALAYEEGKGAKGEKEVEVGQCVGVNEDDQSMNDSEDTVVVGVCDQVGGEPEVMSGGRSELDVTLEDKRSVRLLKNKEAMNLLVTPVKMAKPKVTRRTTRKSPAKGATVSPSRRSGRTSRAPERLGNFVDEEVLQNEMMRRKAEQQFRKKRAMLAKRVTRAATEKQGKAKKVYKKVLQAKKEEELKCSPLSSAKLDWARKEMIKAYAAEYKLEESSLDFVTPGQKDDMVSKGTVLMSKVAKEMESFVLPSMYGGITDKRSGYKSASAYFGSPPGVPVGTLWLSRVECSKDAVHGPWVGGIAGSGKTGAYSIVLSGGYEGDTDDGTVFTYTGSGGRDLSGNKRTAPQSSDQELKGGNLALVINLLRNRPLRVVRGYKLLKRSEYAPQQGYRYDGLYKVVEVWPEQGPSGYVIWRYKMRRDEEGDLPWDGENWRDQEALEIEALEELNGSSPLIPVGTGTLGLNKEFKELASNLGL